MDISYQISWRRSSSGGGTCDLNDIVNGILLIGESALSCQYGCSDSIISPMAYVCTSFNTNDDWSFGEHHRTHIFSSVSDQNTVTIGTVSNAWISAIGGRWNVSTTFSLVARNDTDSVNSSPRISSSLPLYLQQGCTYTIPLPVSDPDNDIIRCRWAVGRECGGICNKFPGAVLDSASCTITYTANNGTGLKAAAIMIEDYAPVSPYNLLSSVALQFIISVSSDQSCSTPTTFPPPITSHPSSVTVIWRENISITLTCMASGMPLYYWERQNGDIPFRAIGALTNALTLINLQPEDAGNYRCVAYRCISQSDESSCVITSDSFSNYAAVTVQGKLLL